jgi:hypothetical protein
MTTTSQPSIIVAEPSLRSLLLRLSVNGNYLGNGTGFIVQGSSAPLLITARHNFTGRHAENGSCLHSTGGLPDEVTIFHHVQNKRGIWSGVTERLYDGDTPLWKEHPKWGPKADLAALPLTDMIGFDFYPYDPSNTGSDIKVGPADVVSVIGFPFGVPFLDDSKLAFHTIPRWKLLGVYSHRINAESDLGVVWKVEALQQLVASL